MARGANRSLNGSEKAAVMMLALGEERAKPLLERFDQEDPQHVAGDEPIESSTVRMRMFLRQ